MARWRYHRSKKPRPIPRVELRVGVLSVLLAAVLAVMGVRLYYLQIIQHKKYSRLADRNRIRIHRLPALRGLVFDAHHHPLINTLPSFEAVIVPEDMRNVRRTVARLEGYLGEDDVMAKLRAAEKDGRSPFEPIAVEDHLDWQQVVALETHQLKLPGVSIQVIPQRHYIYGPLAAHLLGYVGEVTVNDLEHLPGYYMGDEIGKFGLERVFEKTLRGKAGAQEIEVDSVGRRLRLLREIPETPGNSVMLTIDLKVEQAAEEAMANRPGALVAIDPNTGYIIAMVSNPSFNPNLFAQGITPAQWHALSTDPEHPLENRAIQGIYAPGSTFKLVDTIAALEDHAITPNTTYFCPGGLWYGHREYHCWRRGGHGLIALHNAIVESCDVYFYHVGIDLGIDRLSKWAHELGLGEKTGIDLGNENAGVMPSSEWKERHYHQPWYPAETLSVAIGQGYVAATPIQMAELLVEIANGGIRYKPQYVKEIETLGGTVVKRFPPVIERRIPIDPWVLKVLRSAMCGVVNSPNGTARGAHLDNVEVCGKTGTAQVVKEAGNQRIPEKDQPFKYRDNGWFVAFAPADHPQIAIACVIEHGGYGAESAVPVVHQVLKKFFQLYPPPGSQPAAPTPTRVERGAPANSIAERQD